MAAPDLAGLEGFEAGIRSAMLLGLPVDSDRRPVFVLPTAPDDDEDGRGLPWDIDDDMTETPDEVSDVLCAVEFKAAGSNLTDDGGVTAQVGVLIVTLLQDEWEAVNTAESVRVSGAVYRRWFDAPDLALGTHGVYQLYFQAGDL